MWEWPQSVQPFFGIYLQVKGQLHPCDFSLRLAQSGNDIFAQDFPGM